MWETQKGIYWLPKFWSKTDGLTENDVLIRSLESFGNTLFEIKYSKSILTHTKNPDLFLFDTALGALDVGIRQWKINQLSHDELEKVCMH